MYGVRLRCRVPLAVNVNQVEGVRVVGIKAPWDIYVIGCPGCSLRVRNHAFVIALAFGCGTGAAPQAVAAQAVNLHQSFLWGSGDRAGKAAGDNMAGRLLSRPINCAYYNILCLRVQENPCKQSVNIDSVFRQTQPLGQYGKYRENFIRFSAEN